MPFGKQYRFCPNCGKKMFDSYVTTSHVMSMMCSADCRAQWYTKYAAMILGVNAEPEQLCLNLEEELDEMFVGPLHAGNKTD